MIQPLDEFSILIQYAHSPTISSNPKPRQPISHDTIGSDASYIIFSIGKSIKFLCRVQFFYIEQSGEIRTDNHVMGFSPIYTGYSYILQTVMIRLKGIIPKQMIIIIIYRQTIIISNP